MMQVFLMLMLLFFSGAAHAAEEVFVIDNIYADQAADSASNARNLAVADAQRQGFVLLINRMTDPNDRKALPHLTPEGITAMVRSFEVTDEKITGNRYQARFTVYYDEGAVKEFLSLNNVSFLEAKSPPILVLPLFTEGKNNVLWEPENPWRKAWRESLNTPSEANLILPMGDAEDIQRITAEDVKNNQFGALLAFANKYGAQEVMVAESFFVNDGKTLVVRLQPVGPSPTLANLMDYKQEFDATNGAYWTQAVDSIRQKILEQWSARNASLEALSTKQLKLLVALNEGKDWIDIKNRLDALSSISTLNLVELSIKRAVVIAEYRGSLKQFQEDLDKQGLELLQEGDDMVLRRQEAVNAEEGH